MTDKFIYSKKIGRPKKRDNSDIPEIIEDLSEKAKKEIIERWIKEKQGKADKKYMKMIKQLTITQMSKILVFIEQLL